MARPHFRIPSRAVRRRPRGQSAPTIGRPSAACSRGPTSGGRSPAPRKRSRAKRSRSRKRSAGSPLPSPMARLAADHEDLLAVDRMRAQRASRRIRAQVHALRHRPVEMRRRGRRSARARAGRNARPDPRSAGVWPGPRAPPAPVGPRSVRTRAAVDPSPRACRSNTRLPPWSRSSAKPEQVADGVKLGLVGEAHRQRDRERKVAVSRELGREARALAASTSSLDLVAASRAPPCRCVRLAPEVAVDLESSIRRGDDPDASLVRLRVGPRLLGPVSSLERRVGETVQRRELGRRAPRDALADPPGLQHHDVQPSRAAARRSSSRPCRRRRRRLGAALGAEGRASRRAVPVEPRRAGPSRQWVGASHARRATRPPGAENELRRARASGPCRWRCAAASRGTRPRAAPCTRRGCP